MTQGRPRMNADSDAYRNEVLQKTAQKMADVVKKLCEEKGIDLHLRL